MSSDFSSINAFVAFSNSITSTSILVFHSTLLSLCMATKRERSYLEKKKNYSKTRRKSDSSTPWRFDSSR